eukprot:357305-Chlamydomonas_euryale.AAC.6
MHPQIIICLFYDVLEASLKSTRVQPPRFNQVVEALSKELQAAKLPPRTPLLVNSTISKLQICMDPTCNMLTKSHGPTSKSYVAQFLGHSR